MGTRPLAHGETLPLSAPPASWLLKGRGLPGAPCRLTWLLCRQLSLHGGCAPAARLSLRRCHLREDPALPGVDHHVCSGEGTSQASWERPALLGWPGPASHPTPTPAPEEGIMGQ